MKYLKEVDSTNEYLKRNPNEDFLIAEYQREGKGRLGRSFYSPAQRGLYMSFSKEAKSDEPATIIAALAVCKVFPELEIKWVNDLILNGKKAGGILCELVDDRFIIGIGLNLVGEDFPDFADGRVKANEATSLGLENINEAKLIELGNEIRNAYFEILNSCPNIIDEYSSKCSSIGCDIAVYDNYASQNYRLGHSLGIGENGGLIVDFDGTIEVLNAGEITIRNKD
ncbi:MAG: biotin--[acetyl-CoA-carboxylase] ligase [Clostridia bacterium]|nr:biotin--[acetyl-CoA-carboxylase] ligase [Clostridia bacterium]